MSGADLQPTIPKSDRLLEAIFALRVFGFCLVDVGLLLHLAGAVVLPQGAVDLLVPEQCTAGLLLGIERRLLLLELLDELGGVGGVVGAGKDGHGVWLEKCGRF